MRLRAEGKLVRRVAHAVVVCVVAMVLQGCGTAPGVVFDQSRDGPVWPGPPDVPRIKYVGELKSEEDLHAPRSGLQSLGDAIFGRKSVAGMVCPMAVCTDNGSRVFIADSGAQCVHVLDVNSRTYARWDAADTPAKLLQPVGLAFDPAGRLLIADSQAGQVVAIDLSGHLAGVIGRGSLRRPVGLAVDRRSGAIVVVDAGAHQVVMFSRDGGELRRIGERGNGPSQFNYPTNVAMDQDGSVYVSDSLNFRVQAFDSELKFVRSIGRKGDMPGYFSQPKGLSVDSEGHLYVVDANFEAVQLFDREGHLLMAFGREGHGAGEFWLPAGMSIDTQNRVWIADSQNRRVQVFDYLAEAPHP